jgi:hypothetical protein
MMATLDDALRQFDAVQANLHKLEHLWTSIDSMLPSGNDVGSVSNWDEYRDAVRKFEFIARQMPKIDSYSLSWSFDDPDVIVSNAIDCAECRIESPLGLVRYYDSLRSVGENLREYRFRVAVARRKLARETIGDFETTIENLLAELEKMVKGQGPNFSMEQIGGLWEQLRTAVKSIDSVLGDAVKRPPRWSLLMRHLHFGLRCDFDDIVAHDWPAVKTGLQPLLYGDDDPIPVAVEDLGALVASKPRGPVTTKLRWESLSAEDFERLLFNLVDRTEGYENPEWLTHTNAPDRGRDVSVYRHQLDPLVHNRRMRIIVACKHQASVGMTDIVKLREQMRLWPEPKVDELIIATSGRFSTDAVQWIEDHTTKRELPRIEMWPESHLERLLASRPELIAEFHLR